MFWIDASSVESISLSMKGISRIPAAQASGVNGSVESVLQWISSIQEKWLIVFDNASDPSPEAVAGFIPLGNRGNVLITSRNKSMGRAIGFKNLIEIVRMEEADAVTLLLRISHLDSLPKHVHTAKMIVAKLGYIPLAIDQAGAYIGAGRCDMYEYLGILHQTLVSDATSKGVSNATSKGASDYRNEPEQLDVQVVDMRMRLCGAEHPDTLSSMANLAATYKNQGRWDEAEQLYVQVMDMRKKPFGAGTLSSMENLAAIYRSQGSLNKAEQLDIQVMDMRKKLLGAEHPDTLSSMANLAATYRNQGRWSEAEQLEVLVMNMRKKLYGAEHPDTLLSMANLAATYKNQRRWNEVEQLDVQVMDVIKKVLGAGHPDALSSVENLAATYRNQGRWNEAEQLDVEVMNMKKKLIVQIS